jgi:cytochrome c oxidase assembly protein subunit 20
MAEDTREPEPPQGDNASQEEARRPRRPKPKHDFPKTQAGKLWDAFGNPDEPINTMPGGTYNSAGGKPKEVTWRDALKFSEFNKEGRPAFYQTSCARDSLLVGIASGGAVGGLRFIVKGTHLSNSYLIPD